jgi:hypothetical protein
MSDDDDDDDVSNISWMDVAHIHGHNRTGGAMEMPWKCRGMGMDQPPIRMG